MIDRSFRVDGVNGKGVLLIHGLTGAPAEMRPQAKLLFRAGYSIHAPQLAGHGVDGDALLKTDWRNWLDSVSEAYEKFAPSVDEVVVAGICVGGMLGLLLARERPQIAAAALYSMTFMYDGWNMPKWAVKVAPYVKPFANLPLVREISFREPAPFGIKDERLRAIAAGTQGALIAGALDLVPLGAMYQMYCLALHLERVAPTILTPTLILHAREDDMSDVGNSRRIMKALGGPKQLELIEDSYHMIHIDRQHARVGTLTAEFFDRATKTSASRENA
jgi:carboxylesterase